MSDTPYENPEKSSGGANTADGLNQDNQQQTDDLDNGGSEKSGDAEDQ